MDNNPGTMREVTQHELPVNYRVLWQSGLEFSGSYKRTLSLDFSTEFYGPVSKGVGLNENCGDKKEMAHIFK